LSLKHHLDRVVEDMPAKHSFYILLVRGGKCILINKGSVAAKQSELLTVRFLTLLTWFVLLVAIVTTFLSEYTLLNPENKSNH
uniref:Sensor histidine kinase n=1 Tax=Haemonchus placei TaxID=6290 RepID=A0A0N4X563_HAEPC